MGLQSGRLTAAGEHQSRFGSTAGMYDPFAEESTDVLRRRAENLLDEMMLGTADLGGDYAGENGAAGHANGVFTPMEAGVANGVAGESRPSNHDRFEYPAAAAQRATESFAPSSAPALVATAPAPGAASPLDTAPAPGHEDDQVARSAAPTPRVVSAAERYATVANGDGRARPDGDSPANGAVRRQSAALASSMTIGARASLRSNLLPRSTEVDANTAQHELDELLHEVAAVLPPGHEATERSRHLLSKAQTILQSDQSRSAEIEYYLQQVRRILERTQQRNAWSDLYRTRLWSYLVSWTLLALVVLAGIILYRTDFAALLADLAGAAVDAPWVLFAGMTLATACAGALGAILGVYVGIARRQRTEFGYFDRKYGLRGLLMPMFGFFFGLLIALAFATLFHFTGVDPNQSALVLVAIVIAFFVGVGQESLYGAR
jgi:hypothetical protein